MVKNKKALELPVSMIVVLILAILMFALGITLVFKFFTSATEKSEEIDRQTQNEIISAIRTGNDVVALPKTNLQTVVGSKVTFGVGIRNIESFTKDFSILISFDNGYSQGDQPFAQNQIDGLLIEKDWLGNANQHTGIKIEGDKFKLIPLPLRVGSKTTGQQQTQHGTYVFNVCVFDKSTPQASACRVSFKDSTYDKKVHQMSVSV